MSLMIWPRIWWGALAAVALTASEALTLGTDALTFPNGPESGTVEFNTGGAGWSFVPTTNLLVTGIGYLNTYAVGGDPNAVVAIWAGTNTVIASYAGISDPSAQVGDIISVAVPSLPLVAGQPYAITVYSAPLAGSEWSAPCLIIRGWWMMTPSRLPHNCLSIRLGNSTRTAPLPH